MGGIQYSSSGGARTTASGVFGGTFFSGYLVHYRLVGTRILHVLENAWSSLIVVGS